MEAVAEPPQISSGIVARRLEEDWGLSGAHIVSLAGGMNSQTWVVTVDDTRWVAKAVDTGAVRDLRGGLAVAAIVEAAGVPAGAPALTRGGELTVRIDRSELALLAFVEGTELTGEGEHERRMIGSTLARVHRALAGKSVPGAERFHWLDRNAEHLGLRDWIRPAVSRALKRWEGIPPQTLTWGLLHSDPAPEAFRFDASTGTRGLIDWDRALEGPLMYDVASAVMYVGGPHRAEPLLDAYIAAGGLKQSEVDQTLEPMRAIRWAVQADYFARRIATNDMTGIDDPAGNETGLADARRGLSELGI